MLAIIMIAYIMISTCFTQFYKRAVKTVKNAPAQTAGIQFVAVLACLVFLPFFEFRVPSNPWTYILLAISCVLYATNNIMMVSVRKNLEASVISVLKQSYTVLMTLAGFVFYNEQPTPLKVIGIVLIVAGNILVFWERKKTMRTKYALIGAFAFMLSVIAGMIDIGQSGEFSLPIYTLFLYLIPMIFISIGGRVKIVDIVKEYKRANKKDYIVTGVCWSIGYLVLLVAYSIGDVSVVAPLASLEVLSNVIVGYIWQKERKRLPQKIVAAIMVIIGATLIALH